MTAIPDFYDLAQLYSTQFTQYLCGLFMHVTRDSLSAFLPFRSFRDVAG